MLLVLRALHALELEAVRFGWTMLVVQAVKVQLKIVRTMGGAYKIAITVKMPRWFVQVSYVDQDYSRVILSIANVFLFKKTFSGEKKKGFKPRMQDNMGFQVYIASDTDIVFALLQRSLRMIERCYNYLFFVYKLWLISHKFIATFYSQARSSVNFKRWVKRTLQDSINEFINGKLNPLVVVDFRFLSPFLHA